MPDVETDAEGFAGNDGAGFGDKLEFQAGLTQRRTLQEEARKQKECRGEPRLPHQHPLRHQRMTRAELVIDHGFNTARDPVSAQRESRRGYC